MPAISAPNTMINTSLPCHGTVTQERCDILMEKCKQFLSQVFLPSLGLEWSVVPPEDVYEFPILASSYRAKDGLCYEFHYYTGHILQQHSFSTDMVRATCTYGLGVWRGGIPVHSKHLDEAYFDSTHSGFLAYNGKGITETVEVLSDLYTTTVSMSMGESEPWYTSVESPFAEVAHYVRKVLLDHSDLKDWENGGLREYLATLDRTLVNLNTFSLARSLVKECNEVILATKQLSSDYNFMVEETRKDMEAQDEIAKPAGTPYRVGSEHSN